MHRSVKLTLKFATEAKRRRLNKLLEAYTHAVNFFIASLWATPGKLDKKTLARYMNKALSARYCSQALKQALSIVVSTRLAAKATSKPCSLPVFNGGAVLDAKFVKIEAGKGSFDLVLRLSSLAKGSLITIPTRKTKVFNKWASFAGSRLIQGCTLTRNSITVSFEIPDQEPKPGPTMAVDLGVAKLITCSDGTKLGTEFRRIRNKVIRRKPVSKGKRRALIERNNFINRVVKQLPFATLGAIGVEELTGLKTGKRPNRSREFRRKLSPWAYRRVLNRIKELAAQNRVRVLAVSPANTSRTCPACGTVSKDNRSGECFRCVSCNHASDADVVGALNVLARTEDTLRSLKSRKLQKVDEQVLVG